MKFELGYRLRLTPNIYGGPERCSALGFRFDPEHDSWEKKEVRSSAASSFLNMY